MARKPTFEHRHYKAIAAIIASMDSEHAYSRDEIAQHFAGMLGGTNPNYSPSRFESAAKGEPSNGRDKVR